MIQKKEKNITHPIVNETSTEEERALATDFKKLRFTALIMKSVFLGLMLLALLFSLFIPCMKRQPQKEYGTDYSLTLSVADELLGFISMNSALKADAESFIKNGGSELINVENDKEKYKSASEAQILADVAYKKTLSFSKVKAQIDVETFIYLVNNRIGEVAAMIKKLYPQDTAKELINELYKGQRIAVGAVFDLFSYEIERNNYAGLGEFLYKMQYDLSEETFRIAEEKYLLGEYEWNEEFQTTLKTAAAAASVIPELQDEFIYLNGDITRLAEGADYLFQLLFSLIIFILDVLLLIFVIIGGISLYKQFRKQDAQLKGSHKSMPILFACALLHIIMFLIMKDSLFIGAFCAGAVVNALFLIFAVVAQVVYNKHLTKIRKKFSV